MNQIEFYQAKLLYETDSWDLFCALGGTTDIVVVDTRSRQAFDHEHIPSAMSFPHSTMSELTTVNLDREKTYVTYCDGVGCNASTKGALRLSQLGFKVKELQGGLDWWKRDGYATEGLHGIQGKTLGEQA